MYEFTLQCHKFVQICELSNSTSKKIIITTCHNEWININKIITFDNNLCFVNVFECSIIVLLVGLFHLTFFIFTELIFISKKRLGKCLLLSSVIKLVCCINNVIFRINFTNLSDRN